MFRSRRDAQQASIQRMQEDILQEQVEKYHIQAESESLRQRIDTLEQQLKSQNLNRQLIVSMASRDTHDRVIVSDIVQLQHRVGGTSNSFSGNLVCKSATIPVFIKTVQHADSKNENRYLKREFEIMTALQNTMVCS